MAAMPGPGWLCHICAKASGADPFKKAIALRKRKAPEERQRTTNFEFNFFVHDDYCQLLHLVAFTKTLYQLALSLFWFHTNHLLSD